MVSIVAACSDGSMIAIAAGSAIDLIEVSAETSKRRIIADAAVTGLALSSDKRLLAVATGAPTVRIYNCESGEIVSSDSPTPEEFAPLAGQWVGPIGGFLATLLMARWCARRASDRRMAHGLATGIGTALLDVILGFSMSGRGAIEIIFVVSNVGRVLAGLWGGYLASKSSSSKAQE